MKRFRTNIIICMVMLLSAAIFSSISFAGSGSPQAPSELIVGSSGGTKLFGTIMIEYLEYDITNSCFASKVILRLGKDSALTTFSTTDLCLGTSPVDARNKIVGDEYGNPGELTGQILNYFFGPNSGFTKLTVVTFNEYVTPKAVPATSECPNPETVLLTVDPPIANPCHDEHIVADVTLSAN